MSKISELKVNRSLLNPKFEGYKLSLESFPIHSTSLTQSVHQCHASECQWSLLHVHIFANHSKLALDVHSVETPKLYCFLMNGSLCQLTLNREDSTKLVTEIVYQIEFPEDSSNRGDKFDATLSFPSRDFAFLSNGCGALWLCDRRSAPNWKVVHKTSDICDGNAFVIVHSVVKCEGKVLECILKLVEEVNETETKTVNVSSLVWVTFVSDTDLTWKIFRKRKLHTRGIVEYAAISKEISAVCVIGSKPFVFISDSEKPLNSNIIGSGAQENTYVWSQTADEIRMEFCFTEDISNANVNSQITEDKASISIICKNVESVLFTGELYMPIDAEASSWRVNNNKLNVILCKKDAGRMWTEVVVGDNRGEYIPDPDLVEMIGRESKADEAVNYKPVAPESAANSEQLEECDSATLEELSLSWWDGETHRSFFHADLSGHQWLFSVSMCVNDPPYICLRYDVDGILWKISNNPDIATGDCHPHHSTFDAFGYVHAGKQSRKFATCSSDCSYTVICDCNKHAYVYWCQREIESSLRNRKTGKVVTHISKQQLISLNRDEDFLGVVALSKFLFLLTETQCHLAHVGDAND